jgi:hypothetical protein
MVLMRRIALLSLLLFACRDTHQHGVTIVRSGKAAARVVVLTIGVAIKETGPAETVKKFGEVYAFSPEVFAVRRDQPTEIVFWNLQPVSLVSSLLSLISLSLISDSNPSLFPLLTLQSPPSK